MLDPRSAFVSFSASAADRPTVAELDAFIIRFGWFAPARALRRRLTGVNDRVLGLVAPWRGASSLDALRIDVGALLSAASDTMPEMPATSATPAMSEAPATAEVPAAPPADTQPTEPTADERIDRFLSETPRRIVAEEGEPDTEVRTAPELSDEDDVVSESLAEVYLAQGLRAEAAAIYRKLSLLNPEKSVYFAELIGKIENNN